MAHPSMTSSSARRFGKAMGAELSALAAGKYLEKPCIPIRGKLWNKTTYLIYIYIYTKYKISAYIVVTYAFSARVYTHTHIYIYTNAQVNTRGLLFWIGETLRSWDCKPSPVVITCCKAFFGSILSCRFIVTSFFLSAFFSILVQNLSQRKNLLTPLPPTNKVLYSHSVL